MRVVRRLKVGLAVLPVLVLLGTAGEASAYSQIYCGVVLAPNDGTCFSDGLHSWRFNQASYPGPTSHDVEVCEYMWNNRTHNVRGGLQWAYHCATDLVSKDWGPTNRRDYNARVYLGENNENWHTVDGFAYAD
jgi:hypothetical protein